MRLFLLLTLITIITGCHFFENEQSVPEKFNGEWEWYLTSGGWGQNISSDSVDYSIRLNIYRQNEAKWFRNETLYDEFYIQKGKEPWTKGEWVMYSIKHKESCGFVLEYKAELDELRLPSANCLDAPTYYFKKGNN